MDLTSFLQPAASAEPSRSAAVASYAPLPFAPVALYRQGGAARRAVLTWLCLSALAIPSGLLTVYLQWTGVPLSFGGTTMHLSLYVPLLICMPMVLLYGYAWGAVPAWCATLLVAMASGMPLGWGLVFALANPLGLLLLSLVYARTDLRTDLGDVTSVAAFAGATLLSSLAGSAGSFVWAHTNSIETATAYSVWQGWWLGGWLQALCLTGPTMALLARPCSRQLQRLDCDQGNAWRPTMLQTILAALAVLLAYVTAAWHFNSNRLDTVLLQVGDPAVASAIREVTASNGYPLLVVVGVLLLVAYFTYRAVHLWSASLSDANDQLAAINRDLAKQASTDSLTGLASRNVAMEMLSRARSQAVRDGQPLTVVMIDADHFKRVNDRHGHLAGDEVLRVIARRASAQLRGYDLLARYGGEEFLVVLPQTDQTTGGHIAERLRATISKAPIRTPLADIRVSVSLGLATLADGDQDIHALLGRADRALYAAKDAGRNRVVVAPAPATAGATDQRATG